MARRSDNPTAPAVIERFVKQLVVSAKAVMLYPPSSNIPLQTAESAVAALALALRERSEVRLSVTRDGVQFEGAPVFATTAAYQAFANDLYLRRLCDVRFHAGTSARDVVAFLSALRLTPEELAETGGFEGRLWQQGVSTITVTETQVAVIAAGDVEGPAEELSREAVDELVSAAYSGARSEQLTLIKLAGDSSAIARYLMQTYASASGFANVKLMAERLSEIAEVVAEAAEDQRERAMSSLADAFGHFDPEVRRRLLVDELLPEARTNEAIAEVVQRIGVDNLCGMLVDQMDESRVSQEGIGRALRTLALLSRSDREAIARSAAAAMQKEGVSASFAEAVIESVAPHHLRVSDGASARDASNPAAQIVRLIGLAPQSHRTREGEAEFAELAEEARRGITDGDVIEALVTLVGLDPRDAQFAGVMSLIEDSLDVLIERGEIDVAADVADILKQAAEDERFSEGQRQRLVRAVALFTKPSDIRMLAEAMRLYDRDTAEYQAARHLLDGLGSLAIEPLLEELAREPDMAARKSLVELLSEIAPNHIEELGSRTVDPRWYVVRNIISILGTTHAAASLPYIERALHHSEARVRREAIRALSSVPDTKAHMLLVAALSDDNAQNVQLAARYLGIAGIEAAIPSLEAVARGEGRGNRDSGPRVEAIEALGRMGARSSLPSLEAIAGRRSLVSGARAKELRAAAHAAIDRIREGAGGAG